jgi:hypothetical protein
MPSTISPQAHYQLFVAQRLGAPHASTRIEAIQGYIVRRWSEAGLDFGR